MSRKSMCLFHDPLSRCLVTLQLSSRVCVHVRVGEGLWWRVCVYMRESVSVWDAYNMQETSNQMPEIPMGWLGLVGSLKLYVFFAKETYKRDDILQKKPMILRSLRLYNAKPSTYTRCLSNASCYTYCAYCRHLSHLSLHMVHILDNFLIFHYRLCVL